MNLLLSLQAEFRKSKRTASTPFALLAAGLIPLVFLLSGSGTDGVSTETLRSPWASLLNKGFELFGGVLLPLFVLLCGTLLPQLEYRNDTWRLAHLSPQSTARLFFAKYLHFLLLCTFVQAGFIALLLASAAGLQWRVPGMAFADHSFPWRHWLSLNARLWLCLAGWSALQFWLGLRFRNFLLPVGIGFCLWLSGLFLFFDSQASAAAWLPPVYPLWAVLPAQSAQWVSAEVRSVAFCALFLALAWNDFRNRRS